MTVVTSTASQYGITVVADTAVSRRVGDSQPTVLPTGTDKVFYSKSANVALAGWGSAALPDGESYAELLRTIAAGFTASTTLGEAAAQVEQRVNEKLRPLAEALHGWGQLRRGVHVSGFVDGLPCIYHVHTGYPLNHPLQVNKDFPDLHVGSVEAYRRELAEGKRMQLFNGFHDLFGLIGQALTPLRKRLESEFNVKIPEASLQGQLEFDRAIVSLAGGLLRAGGKLPQISLDTTFVAFTSNGEATLPNLLNEAPRLFLDATGSPTSSVNVPIDAGDWSGGKHGDSFDPDRAT